MHIQVIRLWPRRPPDGAVPLGLCCDAEGLSLGPGSPLFRRTQGSDGRPRYRARSLFEVNAILSVGYGTEVDAWPIYGKLEQIAAWMTGGEWTMASLAALHLRLPVLADERALARLEEAEAILKVWYPQLHPRWPAHSEEEQGGRFRPRDGDDPLLVPTQGKAKVFGEIIRRLLPRLLRRPPPAPEKPLSPPIRPLPRPKPEKPPEEGEAPPAGIGHNKPPEEIEPEPSAPKPEEIPNLPKNAPGRTYPSGREVAEALQRALDNGREAVVHAIADAVDAVGWLSGQYRNIVSYLDPPKTYEELSANAQIKGPHPGFEDHHIVEQGEQNS